jgi:phage-related protein
MYTPTLSVGARIKKTQKTPKQEIELAEKLKKEYFNLHGKAT